MIGDMIHTGIGDLGDLCRIEDDPTLALARLCERNDRERL